MSKLRAEMAGAEIGSKKYQDSVKKLGQLDAILQKHKKEVASVGKAYGEFKQMFMSSFAGNLTSSLTEGALSKISQTFKQLTGDVVDFQKEMTNIKTLLTDDEIAKFGENIQQGILNISKKGFDTKDVTKAAYDALQAGHGAATIVQFLDQASVLAVGSVTSLATSVEGLTTVMNSYKLSAAEATNVADAFYSAQKAGKTTSEELSENIGKAAPIAANLSVKYQELLAATAALTNGGISTTESITNLKALFGNLIKPTAEAEKILTKLGIPFGATAVKAAGFTNVLKKLSDANAEFPDDLARAITSIEALTAVSALSGKGFEEYSRVLGMVTTDVGKNSSLQRAYAMQMETTAMMIERNKAELKAQRIEVGEKLSPVLLTLIQLQKAFGKALLNSLDWISRHLPAIQAFTKAIAVLTAAYGAYKATAASTLLIEKTRAVLTVAYTRMTYMLAFAKAKLAGNTTRAAAAQRLLNMSMKANPIGLVIGAITAVVTALVLFRKESDKTADKQKMIARVYEKAAEGADEERAKISQLLLVANSQNMSYDKRIAAVNELNRIVPTYNGYIDEEGNLIAENSSAIQEYIRQLELKMKLQAAQEELVSLWKSEREIMRGITDETKKYTASLINAENAANHSMYIIYTLQAKQAKKSLDELADKLKGNNSLIQELQTEFLNTQSTIADITKDPDKDPDPIADPNKIKEREDALKKHVDNLDAILKRIRDGYAALTRETLTEREKELFELRDSYKEEKKVIDDGIAYFEEMKSNKIKLTEEENKTYTTLLSYRIQSEELYFKNREAINKKYNDKDIEEREAAQKRINEALLSGREQEIYQITEKYNELLELAKKHGLETIDIYEALKKALAEIDKKYAKQKDIFGMDEEDWNNLQGKIEIATALAGNLQQAFSNYHSKLSKQEDATLRQFEQSAEAKTEAIDGQLERGVISEKRAAAKKAAIERELDAQKAEIDRKQAEREKQLAIFQATIDYASGVINVWAKYAANPIAAGLLTLGLSGVYGTQLALINDTELPGYATGAFVKKPTIAALGEKGPELVVNNDTLTNPMYASMAHTLANAQGTPITGYTPPRQGMGAMYGTNKVEAYLMELIRLNSQPFRGYISNTDLTNHQTELNMLDLYGKL